MNIVTLIPRRRRPVPPSEPRAAGAALPAASHDPSPEDEATLSAVFAALGDAPGDTSPAPVTVPVPASEAPLRAPALPAPEPVQAGLPAPAPSPVPPTAVPPAPRLPRPPAAHIRLRAAIAAIRLPKGPAALFAAATAAPAVFIILAAFFGGWFALLAVASFTLLTFAMDELTRGAAPALPDAHEFPVTPRASVLLAILHAGLLLIGLWSLSGNGGNGFFAGLLTFLALGLWLGQVSNSNAHELIHSSDSRLRVTGAVIFASLLFGHHTSAHRLVHHRFVATPDDPNSADLGEGFWAFLPRAWIGSFVAGYEMERALMRPRFGRRARVLHPYALQIATSLGCLILIAALFGLPGVLVWVLLCAYAQLQLLLSDYVQHYGLIRRRTPQGRTEPIGPRHSWNAPHLFSGLQMLNAPRHSDHHLHPARPWTALRIGADGPVPMLPRSLPVMAAIAMVPPVWHRIMDPRALAEQRRSARPADPAHATV